MTSVAVVFPGQGSQKVGMGRAIAENFPQAKEVFESADQALGFSLSRLCFEGPEEELRLTANTQPAILTTSIALWRVLLAEVGLTGADMMAGHSLGEYSANVAAGVMAFEDAVRLVHLRGTLMQQAVPVGQGAMAAVLGAEPATIEAVCKQTPGTVSPANYNAPGQVVIAGAHDAVLAASESLKSHGAKIRPLPVSAPFHCALMKPAQDGLAPHLRETHFADAQCPVYINTEARAETRGDALRDALIAQVSAPVKWQQSITAMRQAGATLFLEVGPGKVLSGLIGRIDKEAKRASIEGPDDMSNLAAMLGPNART